MAVIEAVELLRSALESQSREAQGLLDRAAVCDYRISQPWQLQEALAQVVTGLDTANPAEARELQRWIMRAEQQHSTAGQSAGDGDLAEKTTGKQRARKSWIISEARPLPRTTELPPPTDDEAQALRYLAMPSEDGTDHDDWDAGSAGIRETLRKNLPVAAASIPSPAPGFSSPAGATATTAVGTRQPRQARIPSRFGQELARCRGPLQAIALARSRLPQIDTLLACRFLSAIGYEVGIPWPDAVRLARDIGLFTATPVHEMPAASPRKSAAKFSDSGVIAYTSAIQSAARVAGISVPRLNVLLGLYSGAIQMPGVPVICGPQTPRCDCCKLTTHCTRFPLLRTADVESPVENPAGATGGEKAGIRRNRVSKEAAKVNGIKTWAAEERPRERLLAGERLSNSELLAIILRTGSGRLSAVELARLLLNKFATLHDLERASPQEIMTEMRGHGIGPAKAAEICAAIELGRRVAQPAADRRLGMRQVGSSRDIFELCRARYKAATQEEFLLLVLNTKNRVQKEIPVSLGTLNSSIVHPRDVFRHALREAAAAVIFVHNHPSGDPTPSQEDIYLTSRLVDVGKLLGIQVLDHVIIGSHEWYSFADHGRLAGTG